MPDHVCSTCGKARPCVFVTVCQSLHYPVCDSCRLEPAYGWINHPITDRADSVRTVDVPKPLAATGATVPPGLRPDV